MLIGFRSQWKLQLEPPEEGKMVQRITESEEGHLPGARRDPKGPPEPPRTFESPSRVGFRSAFAEIWRWIGADLEHPLRFFWGEARAIHIDLFLALVTLLRWAWLQEYFVHVHFSLLALLGDFPGVCPVRV